MLRKTRKKLQAFDIANVLIMMVALAVTLGPFWFTLVGSFNDGHDYAYGGVFFWPRAFSLSNYKAVLADMTIYNAFLVSGERTILGTALHVFFTSLFAYGITRKKLAGRKAFMMLALFTMYFSGGLIPTYLVLNKLGMVNHFIVYVVPTMFTAWNMIILQASFREIPDSVIESAKIDGAGEFRIFLTLILPLSKPVLAAIALFAGVGQWNAYFDSMVYTSSPKLQTIQLYLMKVIQSSAEAAAKAERAAIVEDQGQFSNPETIQMATMVAAVLPILIVYPFLQKYFVKGVMIGSVKG